MAATNTYDSGVGASLGSELLASRPLYHTGSVWYVHHTGSDAASPRGKERIRPLATLAQAVTNAAAEDWIVLLAGHAETISGAIVLAGKHRLKIFSEGVGDSRARLTRGANVILLDITTSEDIELNGIVFPESTVASALARVRFAASGNLVESCRFEHGANDTGTGIQYVTGWAGAEHRNTIHISVAASPAAAPGSAINVLDTGAMFRMYKSTLDGGASGWSNPYAFLGSSAIGGFQATLIDQLNDSDGIMATGSSGFRIPRDASGSARWVWTP